MQSATSRDTIQENNVTQAPTVISNAIACFLDYSRYRVCSLNTEFLLLQSLILPPQKVICLYELRVSFLTSPI